MAISFCILLLLIVVVVLLKSVVILREDERLAVIRLGRYIGARGPGLALIAPIFDMPIKIRLDRHVPNWKGMSPDELQAQLRELVLSTQDWSTLRSD